MRQSHGSFSAMPASSAGAEARRDAEAVADVALAVAEHLVVDGEHQRVVAGRCGALGELAREAAVAEDEDLHPARRGAGRGELLQRADRAMAEAEGRAGRRPRRARSRIAVRPEQAGEAGRPDDHRQRQALAEERRPRGRGSAAPFSGCGSSWMSSKAASLRRSVRSSSAPPSAKSKTGRGRGARASRASRRWIGAPLQRLGAHQVEAVEADGVVAEELALLLRRSRLR